MSEQIQLSKDQLADVARNIRTDIKSVFAPLRSGVSVMPTWRELDRYLTFGGIPISLARIIYILGRSYSGKTYLALNLIKKAIDMKKDVLYISLEMSRQQLYSRLIQLYANTNFSELLRGIRGDDAYLDGKIRRLVENCVDEHLTIVQSLGCPEQIYTMIEMVQPQLVVLDYLQIGPKTERDKKASVDQLCKTFQIAKNKYNISIIGLTQTSRLPPTEKTAERYYNIPPALDESRESSEIENSADVMISIARPGGNIKCKPELKDKLVLHLAKDRDQSDPNVNAQPFLLKMQSSGILIDSGEGF